ncbi:MAG TPA: MFS transporter, partial [Agrobacterium sp.]|nr:MFS transporter [Agrobacterium sp.]
FWAIGTLIVALAAWGASLAGVADAWRYIFAVTAFPAVVGLGLRFMVPESPLYLVRRGRSDEAKVIVNRMLVVNGRAPLDAGTGLFQPEVSKGQGIFSPALRQRSIMILAIWFLVSVSYYGVFTWMPAKLAGDGFGFVRGYGFLVLVALAQIPGYALAAYGVEKWGRKPTLIGFCLLSALGCLLFTLATGGAMIATSLLIMSFALLGTWGALYAFTPELYPTESRATGMGAAGAMARLGGLLAPSLLGYAIAQGFGFAIGIFAGLLVLAAIAATMINAETRRVALS